MSRFTRRRKIAAVGVLCFLMAGAGAYAYWTQSGSGSGVAATGSTTTALVIAQTSVVTALSPGSAPQALSGTVTNPNTGTVHVTNVTVSLASIVGSPAGCTLADYQINNPAATVGADVAGGAVATWSGPTIEMLNRNVNQDGCKNAVVNLSYASN